jgi:hypothetical protein
MEWFRTLFNKGVVEWTDLIVNKCPGVLPPSEKNEKDDDKAYSEWSWPLSSLGWSILILIFFLQIGLMWVAGAKASSIEYVNDCRGADFETTREDSEIEAFSSASLKMNSLVGLIQSLAGSSTKQLTNNMRGTSLHDRAITNDTYEELHEEDLALVILEDRLFETPEPVYQPTSIFASINLPQIVRYVLPTVIIGAIVMLFTSNISVGASINLSIRFEEHMIEVPNIVQFSLAETASQLFHAGLYPLLVLVLGFSGIWPYVKVSGLPQMICCR